MRIPTDQWKFTQRVENNSAIVNTARREQLWIDVVLKFFNNLYPSARVLDTSSVIVGDHYPVRQKSGSNHGSELNISITINVRKVCSTLVAFNAEVSKK